MMLTLEHQFRQEQQWRQEQRWRQWLMTDGGCDFETSARLAQRLTERDAEWGRLEQVAADPFEEPPTARRVQQHDS